MLALENFKSTVRPAGNNKFRSLWSLLPYMSMDVSWVLDPFPLEAELSVASSAMGRVPRARQPQQVPHKWQEL